MKKILMTADPIGGVWTYALDLSRALGDHGIEVVLATMGAALRDEQRRDVAQLPNVELHESQFALEWMPNPWSDVDRAGDWLLRLADKTSPDLIHLNGYVHAALPWGAPVLVVAHSCVLSWWRAVKGEPAPNEWDEYAQRVGAGLRAADFVLAPTAAMRASLLENYGALPPSAVVPNGRAAAPFPSANKEPFIFSAGRFWDEGKNLATLQLAAATLDWPVYLAGSEIAKKNVIGLGRLSPNELGKWLSRARIFCLPARYEPFGLSALEAGLAGCALVLGDIPSLREVWGEAAIFVSPNDDEKLRARLQQLIGDSDLRANFARRAKARARQFSLEEMTRNYLQLYHQLVRQTRPVATAA